MEERNIGWELLLSGLMVAVGIGVWILTATFPTLDEGYPGPSLFPRLLASGLIIGGGVLIVGSLRAWRQSSAPRTPFLDSHAGFLKVLATALLVILVPFVMPLIKLVGAAAVAAGLFTLMLGSGAVRSLMVAVMTALIVYVLFARLLGVPVL